VGPTALALLGLALPPDITGRDLRDRSSVSPA
jgi:2,3-bisphosphoglycerate-independent phosphoglycerate mutase